MIRYGPIFCVVLLVVSALYFQRTKRTHTIHLMSVGTFVAASILMVLNFYYINHYGDYTYPSTLSGILGFVKIDALVVLVTMMFYITVTTITWFTNYSLRKYIDPEHIPNYYSLTHLMIAAITIVIFSDYLVAMFVAYGVIIVSAYYMIQIKNKVALPYQKRRFLVLNFFGIALLFAGLLMLVLKLHVFDIEGLNRAINPLDTKDINFYTLSLTLIVVGLSVSGALFPFYNWMPDLFASTPAPLSALLSSITMKISPIIMMKLIFRGFGTDVFRLLHMDHVLIVLGIASMLSGSLFAIYQSDLKKMIAYSTVSQLGYIYLAIGIGNEYGIRIAIYQLLAHTVTKAALYMSVGSIQEQLGTTEISELKGTGRYVPVTLGCFGLGALSMVGIPILPGFITKWNLSLATLAQGQMIPIFIILISGILNGAYYLPIIINGFYGKGHLNERSFKSKAKPIHEVMPMVILILLMIGMGVFANSMFHYINATGFLVTTIGGGGQI